MSIRQQAGDTIIEVLMAMAVMAAILSGAYNMAGKSLTAGRHAQERGEGLKLAESQVELVKVARGNNTVLPSGPQRFCMANATTVTSPGTLNGALPALDADNFATYTSGAASCVMDSDRTSGAGKRYNVSVSNNTNTFTVSVRWERLGGGRDEMQLIYRVYP